MKDTSRRRSKFKTTKTSRRRKEQWPKETSIRTADSTSALSVPAWQTLFDEETILARCIPSTHNDSSTLSYNRFVTPSDSKFSADERAKQHQRCASKRWVPQVAALPKAWFRLLSYEEKHSEVSILMGYEGWFNSSASLASKDYLRIVHMFSYRSDFVN